jgi:hypothetical protein
MTQPEPARRETVEGPSRFLWGLGWVWLSPVLLLAVPLQLLVAGRDGLWLLLLAFVAPLLALLISPTKTHEAGIVSAVAMVVVVGTLLWANLALAADVALWLGRPRWIGPLLAGGGAVFVTLWESRRIQRLLGLLAFLGLVVPLLAILWQTDPLPSRVWSRVASQPAFRFSPESPWVTDGGSVRVRRGVDTLHFEEEHRLIPLTREPLRVVISDGMKVRVEEMAVPPGQSVTLRPGDRLKLDRSVGFRFQAGKRIPGAPISGIGWADAPPGPRWRTLLEFLGLGIALVGGAIVLFTVGRSGAASRGAAGLLGLGSLVLLLWGECWALYAAAYAPELFLGGITGEKLLELPVLVLRGRPAGRWLAALVGAGLFAGFLAGAPALRRALAQVEGAISKDRVAWTGLVAVAALASLWPVDPWTVALLAFGLGASTLGPLTAVGVPAGRPQAAPLAIGVGFVLFVGLAVVGRLAPAEGSVLLAFPALIAAPAASGILLLARHLSPEAE